MKQSSTANSLGVIFNGRPIRYIGYSDTTMTFTYDGDAIPSFEIQVDQARSEYPEIFAQLSARRIAQYEMSCELFHKRGSCI